MNFFKKNIKGMSIIEFIAAIALIAVVSVPLLMNFSGAYVLLSKSRDAVQLNSISRQIKRDIYIAFRDGGDLLKYNPSDFLSITYQAVPTGGAIETGYAVFSYDDAKIQPNYQYSITRIDDIFYTTGDGMDLGKASEIRCLVDVYKADALGNFNSQSIARSFFINIPINFL